MLKKETLKDEIEEIIEEFSFFDDWQDKYEYLISQGKKIEPLNKKNKTENNKIKGCQSTVYFKAEKNKDGLIFFSGESDAAIVQGLIALIFRVFSGRQSKDILETSPEFLNKIGLDKHLSPTRKNGLSSILDAVYSFAKEKT